MVTRDIFKDESETMMMMMMTIITMMMMMMIRINPPLNSLEE